MHSEKTYWTGKSVFVTGGAGFLGSWLIESLIKHGALVTVLLRDYNADRLFTLKKLEQLTTIVMGDLTDFFLLQRILNERAIEVVFHLGAQAIVGVANRSPLSTFHSNIEGTWNILEACRQADWVKKIIVASSDKAYGDSDILPYTEETPLRAQHPYDVSKSCADMIAQSYFHTYGLPVCITRCGNIFGGGDFYSNRLVPKTIQSLLFNELVTVRSNGLLVRDYVYVEDIVHAYLLLAEKMDEPAVLGQVFNFSEENPLSVLEMIELISKIMGKGTVVPHILNETKHEIFKQYLSCKKAKKILGWKPLYGIEYGLKKTIEWYMHFSQSSFFEKQISKEHQSYF